MKIYYFKERILSKFLAWLKAAYTMFIEKVTCLEHEGRAVLVVYLDFSLPQHHPGETDYSWLVWVDD